MSKVLKRLYLGDVVKSFGTKQLRKLTTEKPQEDSIIGTWVFNDVLTFDNLTGTTHIHLKFVSNKSDIIVFDEIVCLTTDSVWSMTYIDDKTTYTPYYKGSWTDDRYKVINVLEEITDVNHISWLKANATKQ